MTSTPGTGHTYPMVALSWALQTAGHEVLVASCGPGLALGGAGARTVDVAPGLSLDAMVGKLSRQHPQMAAQLLQEASGVGYLEAVGGAVAAALRLHPEMVAAIIRTAEEWRPDLVVHSPLQTPSIVAAAKLGVPAVQHGFGFLNPSAESMRELHADLFEQHGVGLPEVRATIDITPPSVVPPEPGMWPMRFVPYNGNGPLPKPLFDLLNSRPEVPRIAVSLGSGPMPGEAALIVERVLAAAPKIDAEFVVVLPRVDLEPFGPLPDNVRAFDWVPYSALLARCSAVVHHAGPGTALGAMVNGLPQVMPDFKGLGRPVVARAIADRGVGRVARPDEIGPELLESVLADEGMRAAAAEVRAEIASMPEPAGIVGRLEDLVARGTGAA
ncbi:nucleotide disphospho-sugar-binding domain-containing protein [Streptomyces sp. I05A-00742]|uniref:nucleotide disphospho-sugar-binding domain-containing protein n=1 Tax=Streptomyces sp. I05A-00742 TaxID=2732853 RepID=UPI0014893B38|nr:nucleotide disphospho-sugar-binding domain-containing protein [Streptomyces sp. I05A-00742]